MKKTITTTKAILILLAVGLSSTNIYSQTAYISNYGSNTVTVINLTTNSVVTTITVGTSPFGVSVSPDGSKVYVANSGTPSVFNSNTVSKISTATNTILSSAVAAAVAPYGICVSPDGSKYYMAGTTTNIVSGVNAITDGSLWAITCGSNPYGIVVSHDNSKVYATNNLDNTVSVVNVTDTTNYIILATIPVGNSPVGITITPDGTKVYVANGNQNTVSIINTATNAVSGTITLATGSNPTGLCVSPDGSKLYVANGTSSLSVINTATNAVITTITVGNGPFGVSITHDGSKVCVTNFVDNTVSIINTTTNAVVATIPVGLQPYSLGNFISTHITSDVPSLSEPVSFTISPNPFNSSTIISFDEFQNNITIKIMDVVGKEIKATNFTGKQFIIEKGDMSKGVYFVQIIDENKNAVNKKIVIQ